MSKLKKSIAGVALAAGVLGGGLAMAPGADAAGWGGGGAWCHNCD